jgi:integrase
MKLTENSVAGLEAPAEGYVIEYDNEHGKAVPGFGVRVTANGVKSFVFSYRFRGRTPRLTIGKFGAWTALAARKRAIELRRLVDSGRDPMAERNAERGAPLMAELFTRYLNEYALPKKKLSSVAEDWSLIHGGKFLFDGKKLGQPDKPFNGTLGHYFSKMQIAAVTRADVMRFHTSLRNTPYRANRALALLSKVMNLAELWEERPDNSNPCRHVEKYKEIERDRHLKDEELAALDKALKRSDPMVAGAIKLLLFTGCRVSEVLGMTWEHIDAKTGVARLEDAKAGARDVQLSTPALAVLSELGTEEGPILGELTYSKLDKAWRQIRKEAGLEGARLHDMRHTTGTLAGGAGANAFLVRDLLGHKTLAMTGRYVGKHANPVKALNEQVSGQIAAAFKGKKAEVVDHPKKKARQ